MLRLCRGEYLVHSIETFMLNDDRIISVTLHKDLAEQRHVVTGAPQNNIRDIIGIAEHTATEEMLVQEICTNYVHRRQVDSRVPLAMSLLHSC